MTAAVKREIVHLPRVVTAADLPEGSLHVVIFGPGHGEAVLVRMPDGRVGVVDGCGEPPAASDRGSPLFSLVESLGETRLLFGCVTHPHQDHFGGFAKLIEKHPPEHLWWSGTQERKFFEYYRAWLKRRGRDEPTGDEEPPGLGLERLVRTLNAVTEAEDALRRPRPKYLADRKELLLHSTLAGNVLVEGLLPSSSGVRAAERDALRALEEGDLADPQRRFDPNRISGALLLSWGRTRVLLGGDALCEKDPYAGWDGLERRVGKVHLIKVPHHASAGADSEGAWAQMRPDLAVVTCVKNARNDQPPRPDMLEKLLKRGGDLVLTSPPSWWTEERHGLIAWPSAWSKPPRASGPSNPALVRRAKPRSAANKHENAVVVRLDDQGNIARVQLHGAARQLNLQGP